MSVRKFFPMGFVSGLLLAALGIVGCSSAAVDQPEAGIKGDVEKLLAGSLAEEAGLGPLSADCDTPPPLEVGQQWKCTGTTSDGGVVEVQASINDEGHIELLTTNLISEVALPQFERVAASNLNNEVGTSLPADSISCGDAPILLGADMEVDCVVSMPSSGLEYDMVMRVTDLDKFYFALQVANEPRSVVEQES